MACHEIAALRLGMMRILGIDDEVERAHELAELGDAREQAGPLRSLSDATDLALLRKHYQAAVSELEGRVARTDPNDPKVGYLRSLILLTKKAELDLDNALDVLQRLYRNLEEMHDLVHELHPVQD